MGDVIVCDVGVLFVGCEFCHSFLVFFVFRSLHFQEADVRAS